MPSDPQHSARPGLARARPRARLSRRVHTSIGSEVLGRLLWVADILSEGSVSTAGDTYYGCTMIRLDLGRAFGAPVPDSIVRELASAVDGSVRVHVWAMRLARREALRRAGWAECRTGSFELRTRVATGVIEVDVDVELPWVAQTGTEKDRVARTQGGR